MPPQPHAALRDIRAAQPAALRAPKAKSSKPNNRTKHATHPEPSEAPKGRRGRPSPTESAEPATKCAASAASSQQVSATSQQAATAQQAAAAHTHTVHTPATNTNQATSPQINPETAPKISEDTHTRRLDAVFLNHYAVHRHERAEDFARLHAEMLKAYEPVTPREELAVLRITQKHWALRRVETFEMAISESIGVGLRQLYPEMNGHAAIALKFLSEEPTAEARFFERMCDYRNHHERSLERLDSFYERIHHNRLGREQKTEAAKPRYLSLSPLDDRIASSARRS